MIKTYVRVELSSEGESPKQIVERMRKIGAVPVVGDYDFELVLDEDERLFDKLEEIHRALKGSSVRYTLTTRTDADSMPAGTTRREVTHYVDLRPAELKKSLYKAKLERWKEMGLDVSELEALLEKDLEHFKEASKQFLRTHLDRLSVVRDKKPTENQMDGEILALLDEHGKTIDELKARTGYSDDQITLSLGRLISSGCAMRVQRDGVEVYCLIPPPAPVVRRPLQLVPAKDDEEAESRVYEALGAREMSRRELVRAARLPKEQLEKALESLVARGKVLVIRRAKQQLYRRA